jgi:hypothetical protein
LQARREIHGVTENRDPGISAILNFSDNSGSTIDADPQLRTNAVFDFKVAASILEPLQDRKSRTTRPHRRVLERNWRTKDRHDAIASKPLHDAALVAHGFVHELGQAPHQRIGGFLPRALREAREAHHIGEKDGDLSALSFHASLRGLRNPG